MKVWLVLWTATLLARHAAVATTAFPIKNHNDNNNDDNDDDEEPFVPVSLTLKELVSLPQGSVAALRHALSTTGMIAIVDEQQQQQETTTNPQVSRLALQEWCLCAQDMSQTNNNNNKNHPHPHDAASSSSSSSSSSHTQVITLERGQTTRTTLATATVGTHHLLALDESVCGTRATNVLEDLRDDVQQVSTAFVQALDHVMGTSTTTTTSSSSSSHPPPPLLHDTYGKAYRTVQQIVEAATHLEHYHVYDKAKTEQQHEQVASTTTTTTLDFHTDAGLFLVFVPALDCNSSNNNNNNNKNSDDAELSDTSFWIQTSLTTTTTTTHAVQRRVMVQFPPQTRAVVMLGAGAQQWLTQQEQEQEQQLHLQATVHAVHMQPGQRRAWYGKMHLVPDHAIVQTVPTTKTFQDLKQSITTASIALATTPTDNKDENVIHRLQSPSVGCGDVPVTPSRLSLNPRQQQQLQLQEEEESTSTSRKRQYRRLQHVGHPGECNNVTNFFCWYQCLDIPNADSLEGYVNEGYSLYCVDPAVLASTGNQVSKAAEPCQQGFVHNGACQGSWQPTAPRVPRAANFDYLDENRDVLFDDEQFCYGGVSMYMDGFHWVHDSLCVIYLFPGWVLSSRAKLAWASLGTILVGILLEGIIWQRRQVAHKMSAGAMRLGVGSFMYGLQLTVGYFLMLVIMTYSGVLFLSTVMGLMLGHVVFNPKDGLWAGPKKRSSAAAGIDASVNDLMNEGLPRTCDCNEAKTEGAGAGSAADSNGDINNQGVPDGATPCCQYTA